LNLNVRGAIEILFDRLAEDGNISPEDNAQLGKAWKIRNAAVHAGRPPDPEQVENMIDTIERICRPWEQPR
jgi:uncharacterized protein YutE (UPF0331/DUF86 family)